MPAAQLIYWREMALYFWRDVKTVRVLPLTNADKSRWPWKPRIFLLYYVGVGNVGVLSFHGLAYY